MGHKSEPLPHLDTFGASHVAAPTLSLPVYPPGQTSDSHANDGASWGPLVGNFRLAGSGVFGSATQEWSKSLLPPKSHGVPHQARPSDACSAIGGGHETQNASQPGPLPWPMQSPFGSAAATPVAVAAPPVPNAARLLTSCTGWQSPPHSGETHTASASLAAGAAQLTGFAGLPTTQSAPVQDSSLEAVVGRPCDDAPMLDKGADAPAAGSHAAAAPGALNSRCDGQPLAASPLELSLRAVVAAATAAVTAAAASTAAGAAGDLPPDAGLEGAHAPTAGAAAAAAPGHALPGASPVDYLSVTALSPVMLPGPVRVQVFSKGRGRKGNSAYDAEEARGKAAAGRTRGAVGIFHPDRYLTRGDCIECDGKMMSRGRFEQLAGCHTAKWHVSIKVLPSGMTLGNWLRKHGLPLLQGAPRKRRKGVHGDDEAGNEVEEDGDNSASLPFLGGAPLQGADSLAALAHAPSAGAQEEPPGECSAAALCPAAHEPAAADEWYSFGDPQQLNAAEGLGLFAAVGGPGDEDEDEDDALNALLEDDSFMQDVLELGAQAHETYEPPPGQQQGTAVAAEDVAWTSPGPTAMSPIGAGAGAAEGGRQGHLDAAGAGCASDRAAAASPYSLQGGGPPRSAGGGDGAALAFGRSAAQRPCDWLASGVAAEGSERHAEPLAGLFGADEVAEHSGGSAAVLSDQSAALDDSHATATSAQPRNGNELLLWGPAQAGRRNGMECASGDVEHASPYGPFVPMRRPGPPSHGNLHPIAPQAAPGFRWGARDHAMGLPAGFTDQRVMYGPWVARTQADQTMHPGQTWLRDGVRARVRPASASSAFAHTPEWQHYRHRLILQHEHHEQQQQHLYGEQLHPGRGAQAAPAPVGWRVSRLQHAALANAAPGPSYHPAPSAVHAAFQRERSAPSGQYPASPQGWPPPPPLRVASGRALGMGAFTGPPGAGTAPRSPPAWADERMRAGVEQSAAMSPYCRPPARVPPLGSRAPGPGPAAPMASLWGWQGDSSAGSMPHPLGPM